MFQRGQGGDRGCVDAHIMQGKTAMMGERRSVGEGRVEEVGGKSWREAPTSIQTLS